MNSQPLSITLFGALESQYGVIDYFVEELAAALQRQGAICSILRLDRKSPMDFLRTLTTHPPDCTLSFNGLLPDRRGQFLADTIGVPHVAFVTDAPTHFFPLLKSQKTVIASVDLDFCRTFQAAPFLHAFFCPHGGSASLVRQEKEPLYDVLMLNSFIDAPALAQSWSDRYPAPLVRVLHEAAERTWQEEEVSYLNAFVEGVDGSIRRGDALDPAQIDHRQALDDLQAYVGGMSRLRWLESIEVCQVDVFGSDPEGWRRLLPQKKNIRFHPPVPFHEALDLMGRCRVLLHCTPEIKRGGHERLFSGLLLEAALVCLATPYLRQEFVSGKELELISYGDEVSLNQTLHHLLQEEPQRRQTAQAGRESALARHTWDVRAKQILSALPQLLRNLNGAVGGRAAWLDRGENSITNTERL